MAQVAHKAVHSGICLLDVAACLMFRTLPAHTLQCTAQYMYWQEDFASIERSHPVLREYMLSAARLRLQNASSFVPVGLRATPGKATYLAPLAGGRHAERQLFFFRYGKTVPCAQSLCRRNVLCPSLIENIV